jgi:hypothetical protein
MEIKSTGMKTAVSALKATTATMDKPAPAAATTDPGSPGMSADKGIGAIKSAAALALGQSNLPAIVQAAAKAFVDGLTNTDIAKAGESMAAYNEMTEMMTPEQFKQTQDEIGRLLSQ